MLHSLTRNIICGQNKCCSILKSSDALRMPRNRTFIPRLQIKMSQMSSNYRGSEKKIEKPDGPAYLQFVGSGADGAARSIYFFTEYNRYVFNVGEGTQRLAHEYKLKIARLEHIFITQPVWENLGGLPGLALTVQECGVPDLTLHGPYGVDTLFSATDQFVRLEVLKIKMAKCDRGTSYSDPAISVTYVPLETDEKETLEKNNAEPSESSPERNEDDALGYYSQMNRKKMRISTFIPIKRNHLSRISMAYICRLKPKSGHLNLEACVERNVPPGPLLGRLKAGEDVTLVDGSIVRAADVKEADEPGAVFIIVDCPSERFLDSLINEELFKKHQQVTDDNDIPRYIIHFTPASVVNSEKYQKWMKLFPESTLHINSNENNKCLGMVGTHDIQYKLNLLSKEVFPLLKDDSIPIVKLPVCDSEQDEIEEILERAKRRSKFNNEDDVKPEQFNFPDDMGRTLRCLPLRCMDSVNVTDFIYMNVNEFVKSMTRKCGFNEDLKSLHQKIQELELENIEKRPFPRITFLGTGSCIPNKCRNTSAILASFADDSHVIMDCGEGTYGQLVRHFGLSRTEQILVNTNIIFISHMHADHHLGLITLLKSRKKAMQNLGLPHQKVLITAPYTLKFWLNKYQASFENIKDCYELISNKDLEYRSKDSDIHSKVKSVAPFEDFTTSYVVHCPNSFGVSIIDLKGNKITYSGDTMPSKDLLEIGRDSTLLIHEATFEDALISEAESKLHSTFHQAIKMGKDMNAQFTILTHFSQRYAKIPLIDEKFDDKVGIAFDNMEVTLDDLPKLPLMYPILQLMFDEEIDNMQTKQIKRRKVISLMQE